MKSLTECPQVAGRAMALGAAKFSIASLPYNHLLFGMITMEDQDSLNCFPTRIRGGRSRVPVVETNDLHDGETT